MKLAYLLFLSTLIGLMLLSTKIKANTGFYSTAYHLQFCEANPFHPNCVMSSLGGINSLEKERKREYNDDYYELDDYRTEVGQDMEDMRESL